MGKKKTKKYYYSTSKSSKSSKSNSSSYKTSSRKFKKSLKKTLKKKGSKLYNSSDTISVLTKSRTNNTVKKNKTINMINAIYKKFKNKKFDLIKYIKLMQDVKINYLDKCNLNELQNIKYDLNININNKKFELINNFIQSCITFNFVDKIDFKPVYNAKNNSFNKELPCLKKGYKYIKELSSGAYGVVHLIKKNNKKYAVKKIEIKYSSYNTVKEQIDNIKNEIKILKKISNLHISPKLYDYYLCKDNRGFAVYLIMDYIQGITLSKYMENNVLTNKLKKEIENKFKILHKNNILHNDVHGDNVMITKNKEIFLIDFGMGGTIKDFLKNTYGNLFYNYNIKNIKIEILASILIKMKVI